METEARLEEDAGAVAGGEAVPRLASLDAFRGFTMLWIIGGTPLIVALLHAAGDHAILNALAAQFRHSEWEGLHYWDVIWPSFMLAVGIALPFSHAKRALVQSRRRMRWDAFRRAVILFLLGALRTSVHLGEPRLVELSSALQPIAIASFVGFLLVEKSDRVLAALTGAIFVFYALLLAFVPATGIPAGSYTPLANLVSSVDLAVLGRTEPKGWGTVLTTFPPIATTLVGIIIGRLLMGRRAVSMKIKIMAAIGISGVLLGWGMGLFIPVIMKLWTTSYGILATGWSCLLFLAFYWIMDVRGYRRWAFCLVVIGANAIAIYMGKSLFRISGIVDIFSKPLAAHAGALGPALSAACVLGVEWLILYWMYKRRIFIKA